MKRAWFRLIPFIAPVILHKLEKMKLSIDRIRDLSASDIAGMLSQRLEAGKAVRRAAHNLPRLEVEAEISPITRTIVRVSLTIHSDFTWYLVSSQS